MANHYLQFSEELPIKAAEAAWFEALLDSLSDELLTEPSHDTFGGAKIDKAFKAIRGWEGWQSLDFQYEIHDGHVWFYAEESGEPYLVGLVVQQYFKTFRDLAVRPVFTLTWASFCDKLRVSEFGGGALIVTRKRIEIMEVGDWIDQRLKRSGT